jgi:hypothetical protein
MRLFEARAGVVSLGNGAMLVQAIEHGGVHLGVAESRDFVGLR